MDDSDIGPYTAKIFNSVSEVDAGFNLCIKGMYNTTYSNVKTVLWSIS